MKKKITCFLSLVIIVAIVTGCGQSFEMITMEQLEETFASLVETSDEERINFELPGHDTYAYDSLSDAEKLWYDDINAVLSVRADDTAELSKEGFKQGLTETDVDRIYECVLIDHPEYFYVEGYEYTQYSARGEVVGIEISGSYSLNLEECISRKAEIEAAAVELLQRIPAESSDYDKIKYVYETIIYNTDYRMDAADNQNIYSVFAGHASVCQGYAKATQYLLNSLGVECTIVFGEIDTGEGHAWNLVKADDAYYYVDTTWGDASYLAGTPGMEEVTDPEINYDYLCITTEQLLRTHTITHEIELPLCSTDTDNYYVQEGCYFNSYDEEQLKREFEEVLLEGKSVITLKCSDADIYTLMCQELIASQKVFDYLDDSYETISYVESEEQLSLTFWVTK